MKTEAGIILRAQTKQGNDLQLVLGYEEGARPQAAEDKVQIVTSLAGIYAGRITFYGQCAPAAITPSSERRDPAVAAALLTGILLGWDRSNGDGAVCTVGQIETKPGRSDMIPASVSMSFDIRADSEAALEKAASAIARFAGDVEQGRSHIKSDIEFTVREKPLNLPAAGVSRLVEAAQKQGLSYELVSGFGGLAPSQLDGQKNVSIVVLPDERVSI